MYHLRNVNVPLTPIHQAKKLDWWAANEECKRKMTYWNNADIGDTGKVEKKIVKSYLFIPETGDEFYRVVRHLIRLESHK